MSRRKRPQQQPDAPSVSQSAAAHSSTTGPGPLTFVAGVLFVARYFLPAESAALGETLWIVQLWLLSAVLWLWMAARDAHRMRRFDLLDVGVALLVGGHVLSAIIVLTTEGDKRAALNMLWEWTGIGVATLILREVVDREGGRGRMTSLVVISGMSLAGLGLWQHHLWYPSLSAKLAEYERLSTSPTAADGDPADIRDRLRDLRNELGPLAASGDSSEQQLLRSRVSASTEPIGRFALANTFAGLLVVALLLAMGRLLNVTSAERRSLWFWISVLMTLAMAYCFWLTKSRTATVGLVVALAAWGIGSRRAVFQASTVRWAVIASGILLLGLPLIASLTGGLDREVITEAPKSLEYRLEYWTATRVVIREAPIFGVGPGNFRQAYLKHKLPGASEEVLDPHNLVLDVQANGGFLAFMGLCVLLLSMLRMVSRPAASRTPGEVSLTTQPIRREFIWSIGVGVVSLLLASFVEILGGIGLTPGGWWLLALWGLSSLAWSGVRRSDVNSCAPGVASLALVIHLLGAGGIAMPAVLQTLILLAACTAPVSVDQQSGVDVIPETLPWRTMGAAAICLCLAIASAFTATLPVSASVTQTQLGRAAIAEGNLRQAITDFQRAIEADPLNWQPWHDLAIAHALDWQRTGGTDNDAFDRAVRAETEAIGLNPHSHGGWRSLGELWWRRFELHGRASDAGEAILAFRQATLRYPHHAGIQASLARAADAAEDRGVALAAAESALVLDKANRQQGHVDKYLPDSLRDSLLRIVKSTQEGL